jgi:hypothetical protein
MGAAAVSTLAGTRLITVAPVSPVLEQILPFVRGFTLFWWSTATWWIPMLVIVGVWRLVYRLPSSSRSRAFSCTSRCSHGRMAFVGLLLELKPPLTPLRTP